MLSLVRTIWEAGFNGWSLMKRLGDMARVGVWMLTPQFARTLLPRKTTALGLARFMT